MTDSQEDLAPTEPPRGGGRVRVAVIVAVAAVFAILLLAKAVGAPQASLENTTPGPAAAVSSGGPSQARGDALADYDAALRGGKPIYVLFHSLTCEPCVQISAVADAVVPDYADRVTFVNAITDDTSAQRLAARFSFQYIPTSFFLDPDGSVADSFTGVLTAQDMRARLDKLVAR
ncbi:MAG: thioredoxin family protein [Coriobacteriia bacterium]|nr:thioredoxin family protein [Coriobacteriia bacterium]